MLREVGGPGVDCQIPVEQNRCAMACQGCGAVLLYPLSARRPPPLRWGMNCVPNLTKLLNNGRIM